MIQLLIDNPLLLLFVVAAIGYPLGRINIGGSSLGVAAVLFVGLIIGLLHPDLKLPEIVYQIGLVVFVYAIGLSSGTGFSLSWRLRSSSAFRKLATHANLRTSVKSPYCIGGCTTAPSA